VEDGVLGWEVPRTLLGMIAIGSRHIEVPVTEIGFLRLRRVVPHPVRWVIGAAGVVVPWCFVPWWAAVPLLVLGLWAILITLGPHLELETKSGEIQRAPVCFGHSLDAELYIAAVEDMIRPPAV